MGKKTKVVTITLIILILATIITLAIFNKKERKVVAKVKNILTVDKLEFKDLNNNGQLDKYEDWRLPSEERAEDLISQMTLEEKAGMLLINTQTMGVDQEDKSLTSNDGIIDDETTDDSYKIYMNKIGTTKTIEELNIRHIILRTNNSAIDIARWTNKLNEISEGTRLGIPVVVTSNSRNELLSEEFEYNEKSVTTRYPGTLGIAAATLGEIENGIDSKIIEKFANVVNQEWRALGIRKGYMYVADIATDPRWMRIGETFGEDAEFVSDTISKIVKGTQGEVLNSNGIALTLKHFPGSGARQNGIDPHFEIGKDAIFVTENSLINYHLKPFEAAIKAGVSSIMPYYSMPTTKSAQQIYKDETIDMEGPAFAFNKEFLTDLLRNKMEFKGYINTDSGVIDFISWGEEDKTETERTADALNAGTDLISDTNKIELVINAYNQGLVTEDTINMSCKRVLVEMFNLGLFENPYVEESKAKEQVATKENIEEAYQTHLKSVVLLKNKEETLPLTDDKLKNKKVCIKFIGLFSDYTYENTVKTKIQEIDKNIILTDYYEEADYAILYLSPSTTSQLNSDKITVNIDSTSLGIGNIEKYQNICDKIHTNGGKVITVLKFSNPWILTNVEPYTDGLVGTFNTYSKAWYEVLRGKYNPTGVLPYTLPRSEDVIKIDENGNCISPNDVPGYDKNKYLTEGMKYEYVDTEGNSYKLRYGLRFN